MVRLHGFRHKVGSEGATVGPLSSLSLAEIAQILNLGAKTARIDLRADGECGSVWFASGTPVHASCGNSMTGAPAFYRMLGWKRGEFVIEHAATTDKRSLEGDPMYHVLEGLRRVDEQGDGSPPVPLPPISEPQDSTQRLPILLGILLVCLAGAAWWLWAAGPDSAPSAALAEDSGAALTTVIPLAPSHAAPARVRPAPKASKPSPPVSKSAPVEPVAEATPARTETADPTPEPPLAEAAAGISALADPSVSEAAPEAPADEAAKAAPEPSGRVGLVLRSKLKEGTLTLLIDGQPAYSAPLRKTSGFAWHRDAADRFAATIPVPPGSHRLVARIDLGSGAAISTGDVPFTVEPDGVTELTVVAGAKQTRPLAVEIGGKAVTGADRAAAGPDPARPTGGAGAPAGIDSDSAPLEKD